MARAFEPQVATANHLLDGDVVYFTEHGDWTRHLTEAVVAETPDQAETLLGAASLFPQDVVGVYLANVQVIDGKPEPSHFREIFRTRGPSNYHHGKQAEA